MRRKCRIILLIILIISLGISLSLQAAKSDKTIKQAQNRLKELGYNPGPVDGIWGKKTEAAIKKFQQEKNLQVTGELDEKTREKLGL